jgi:hypothetical protein
MDCLHCGRPLTFLKKWGDSRFCCDEHARNWKASVQETMLERLRVSAEQFRRVVQKSRLAEVPEPEPVVETFTAPPAAGFRISAASPVESGLGPLLQNVMAPSVLGVELPTGPAMALSATRTASGSFPLSTDASLVVPVDTALAVATQSSS